MKTKTLRATEWDVPHIGRFTVSYRGEVLNMDVTGSELFSYARKFGYSHIELDRTFHGTRRIKVPTAEQEA